MYWTSGCWNQQSFGPDEPGINSQVPVPTLASSYSYSAAIGSIDYQTRLSDFHRNRKVDQSQSYLMSFI